jgi:hypothetical protein
VAIDEKFGAIAIVDALGASTFSVAAAKAFLSDRDKSITSAQNAHDFGTTVVRTFLDKDLKPLTTRNAGSGLGT